MLLTSPARLAIALAAAAALATPAAAQDWKGNGRMEGYVRDGDGEPLVGATVKMHNPGRGGGPTISTDEKGKWAVLGLAAGGWQIDISADGFVTRRLTINLPSESARLKPVQIALEKAKPKGPPPELVGSLDTADKAYQAGDYAAARAGYEKALEVYSTSDQVDRTSPNSEGFLSEIHLQIARCYSQEENYEKELEHLDFVIEADPANQNLRLIAAQEALKGGMLERGEELLATVDASAVSEPAFFFNVAVLYLNQGSPERAIPYLTRSIEVDPAFVDGYYQRALANFQQQKLAEAQADLEKVLELAPESEQAETAKRLIEAIAQSSGEQEPGGAGA